MNATSPSFRIRQAVPASLAVIALLLASSHSAHAANIITFDNNATSCGGSTICSTNGTTGYLDNGTGQAFDLSTLTSWFQIDTGSTNYLPSTQSEIEPEGGAGSFLVVNDTSTTVSLTSYSISLTDTFNSGTPSVTYCSGSSGPLCDNFQAGKGAGASGGSWEALSGADYNSCTNGSSGMGYACESNGGQAAANFSANMATYTWGDLDIAPGGTFLITFSSFNNSVYTTPTVTPEPSSLLMLGTGLLGLGGIVRRKLMA